jgi:hypothetical protein
MCLRMASSEAVVGRRIWVACCLGHGWATADDDGACDAACRMRRMHPMQLGWPCQSVIGQRDCQAFAYQQC